MAALGLLVAALCAAPAQAGCGAPNPEGRNRVLLTTVLGEICFDLLDEPDEAPETVENFLNYYERGDFWDSFFHRLVPGFVLQGGGFRYTAADGYEAIPQDPPVANDPDPVNRSNVRGTVAMAKLANQPDSATNQFFINLADNVGLDSSNGGFTVFARVVAEDMAVVDEISALHREYGPYAIADPLRSQFGNLPVLEVLERAPAGYGCLILYPDPIQNAQGAPVPLGIDNCMGDQAARTASIAATIAAMDPQVPERLVMVPEPAAPLLLAAGAALLALAGRAQPGARR